MPTPMHVYDEIAERYGIDPHDSKAVLNFFSTEIYNLEPDTQRNIAEELLARDGEPVKSSISNLKNDDFVPLPDPTKIVRAEDSYRKDRRKNMHISDIDIKHVINLINQHTKK